jgi:MoaA/NifB/PqqE/SkfB family radical SAM enzyme|tara:strand:+ start:447 stop:1565 length:1119 start_codon:yes stop_codon:yes gene_type:complete
MNEKIVKKKPKQFYHHLQKAVFKKNQSPSYLIFYPTSRCNLKCAHCFYHDSLNKRFKELSLDEIRKFTSTMDPLLSLILTGGEPYLRHDLDEIVKIFYENTRVPVVTIPSNGWYLDKMERQIKNMMEWCPDLILNQLISIDGLEEDHCKIRGHQDSFSKAIEATKLVKKIQKETDRVNLGIQTTFTSQNQNKMKDIIKGIYEIAKPDNITIALVRGDPKEKVNENLDIKLYQEAVEYRNELFLSRKMSGHARFPGNKLATAGRIILNRKVQDIYETGKYQMPCYSANLSGVMYEEGQVFPCELLDKKHMIGNIRDFNLNFKSLWLSKKAKDEVDFIKKTKCFCTHECFNSVNILFNPKFYPELIKLSLSMIK